MERLRCVGIAAMKFRRQPFFERARALFQPLYGARVEVVLTHQDERDVEGIDPLVARVTAMDVTPRPDENPGEDREEDRDAHAEESARIEPPIARRGGNPFDRGIRDGSVASLVIARIATGVVEQRVRKGGTRSATSE